MGTLRALAESKGFSLDRSRAPGQWYLYNEHGVQTRNPLIGSLDFTPEEAIAFLRSQEESL
jgi:hypothetical protein